jgi:hypothetical protein
VQFPVDLGVQVVLELSIDVDQTEGSFTEGEEQQDRESAQQTIRQQAAHRVSDTRRMRQ